MDAQSMCYQKCDMEQLPDKATIQTLYNAIKLLIFKELNDYNSEDYPIPF